MIPKGFVAAALLGGALIAGQPASADTVLILRTNVQTGPNTWGPALVVYRGQRVDAFTVASGALSRREVFDPRAAIGFVAGQLGIDIDVTPCVYCVGGFSGTSADCVEVTLARVGGTPGESAPEIPPTPPTVVGPVPEPPENPDPRPGDCGPTTGDCGGCGPIIGDCGGCGPDSPSETDELS